MEDDIQSKLSKKVIKFTKKPAKTGRNYAFYIPISYIKNGLIDPNQKYTVYIAPSDEE